MKYKKKKTYFKENKQTYACPNCCASNSVHADFCVKCNSALGFMNTTDPAKQISKIGVVRKGFRQRLWGRNKDRDTEMEMIITLSLFLLGCIVISIYCFTH